MIAWSRCSRSRARALLPRDHDRDARGRRVRGQVRHLTQLSASFYTPAKTASDLAANAPKNTQTSAVGARGRSPAHPALFLGLRRHDCVTSPTLSLYVLFAIPVIVLPLCAFFGRWCAALPHRAGTRSRTPRLRRRLIGACGPCSLTHTAAARAPAAVRARVRGPSVDAARAVLTGHHLPPRGVSSASSLVRRQDVLTGRHARGLRQFGCWVFAQRATAVSEVGELSRRGTRPSAPEILPSAMSAAHRRGRWRCADAARRNRLRDVRLAIGAADIDVLVTCRSRKAGREGAM